MQLDLTLRQFTRAAGVLLVIGTWLRDDEFQWRPALVLIRAADEGKRVPVPCVVPLANAWIWSEDIGDPRLAARAAYQFARALRLDDDPMNGPRIAGIINDHLPDLVRIPPLPSSERHERSVAEGLIRDLSAGTVTELDIRA
jgi:hypothetical protein